MKLDLKNLEKISESQQRAIYSLEPYAQLVLKIIFHQPGKCNTYCKELSRENKISQQFINDENNFLINLDYKQDVQNGKLLLDLNKQNGIFCQAYANSYSDLNTDNEDQNTQDCSSGENFQCFSSNNGSEKQISNKNKSIEEFDVEDKKQIEINGVHGCCSIMSLAEGGDLVDLANSNNKKFFDLKLIKKIFSQIAQSVKIMHNKGYTHNDIKLDNIFVFYQEKRENQQVISFKIGDFGFSRKIHKSHGQLLTACKQYQLFQNRQNDMLAPEIQEFRRNFQEKHMKKKNQQKIQQQKNAEPFDETKGDIFALGMSIFLAFAKILPFQDPNTSNKLNDPAYKNFMSCDQENFWSHFPNTANQIRKNACSLNSIEDLNSFFDLIINMLYPDPKKRYNIDQVLNHPFFMI
ncbi:Protein kinase-like domain [Pseudocohnilembus persalinus]|uniref:Protein kinase-like domain n=1 Tax=Pseudocohnilembus persalinus TaxID=266149 RepID=A0A0V0R353_PSEPJ|nr:Protein kinase-like domain [Pseudocohnilembus persalinus]|eukprot:KRX08950.1 Protein kinase-like domain [Pseudocohnilembus persalinus]